MINLAPWDVAFQNSCISAGSGPAGGGGDEIKRLLDTKSDELKPVFFDGMTE